jgi:hypothetical protein
MDSIKVTSHMILHDHSTVPIKGSLLLHDFVEGRIEGTGLDLRLHPALLKRG